MRSFRLIGFVAIALLVSSSALAGPLISNGLLVYYNFDSVGESVVDGSGNGYHGTIMGDVTYSSEGKIGGCASFGDRTYNEITEKYEYNYVSLPADDIYDDGKIPTTNFSIAAWCYITPKTGDNQGDHYEIFSTSTWIPGADPPKRTMVVHTELRPRDGYPWTETPDYRFVLRERSDDPASANKYTIGDVKAEVTGTEGFFDDWHHIAMTYDKSTTTMSIYRDGVLMAEKTDCSDYSMADSWDAGASVGATPDFTRQFFGLMDDFYLYKKTLSAGAVYALAHTTLVGDADCDGSVDLTDLTLLGQNWRGTDKSWGEGDFNDDGLVDLTDLTLLGQNWRATGLSFIEAIPLVNFIEEVPEPGTIALLAIAALGLAAETFRRRWR